MSIREMWCYFPRDGRRSMIFGGAEAGFLVAMAVLTFVWAPPERRWGAVVILVMAAGVALAEYVSLSRLADAFRHAGREAE